MTETILDPRPNRDGLEEFIVMPDGKIVSMWRTYRYTTYKDMHEKNGVTHIGWLDTRPLQGCDNPYDEHVTRLNALIHDLHARIIDLESRLKDVL